MSGTALSSVLIVEDEPVLRASMARGLGKLPNVEVREAGTVDQALALIDASPPDCIISDIDLPRRTGLELVGELKRRQLVVPLLFVSAYLTAYRSQIPRNANVEILEKPVPLEELRARVLAQLREPRRARAPFGVTDYVQLACMGNHSVEILVSWPPDGMGRIVVAKGNIWSAKVGEDTGLVAFRRLAFHPGGSAECRALDGEPGPRSIEAPWEMVLIEGARLADEEARQAVRETRRAPVVAPAPPVVAGAADPARALTYGDLWDIGVDALLRKDYAGALQAFVSARELRPDDGRVLANLKRLADMGYPAPPPGRGS